MAISVAERAVSGDDSKDASRREIFSVRLAALAVPDSEGLLKSRANAHFEQAKRDREAAEDKRIPSAQREVYRTEYEWHDLAHVALTAELEGTATIADFVEDLQMHTPTVSYEDALIAEFSDDSGAEHHLAFEALAA